MLRVCAVTIFSIKQGGEDQMKLILRTTRGALLAGAFLEKFGGDSVAETKRNYEGYLLQLKEY